MRFDLAGTYFALLAQACGFWWVLANFPPDPIRSSKGCR
jgi:hypothetical protein